MAACLIIFSILLSGSVRAESFAIRDVVLIDGTGKPPVPNAVLVIRDDRIVFAGSGETIPVPKGIRTVHFPGMYVIPGLMDANVHLYYWLEPESLVKFEGHYDDIILEAAQIALKYGVTTVFDTWGPLAALAAVRDQINAGATPGARIFIAGNIIGLDGPLSADFNLGDGSVSRIFNRNTVERINAYWTLDVGADLLWLEAEQVGARIRDYIIAYRPDFLKYAGSTHAALQFISFSQDVQNAIVKEGHGAGLTVQSHTYSLESLKMEIQAGADLLTHCDLTGMQPMSSAVVQTISTRRIPCAALLETDARVAWWRDNRPERLPELSEMMQIKHANDGALIRAGAVLAMATDAGGYSPLQSESTRGQPDVSTRIGEAAALWIQAARELGMKPMDALMAATRNVAAAYHKDGDLGTLEPGKMADLVVLEGDPLADVRNYRRIHAIVKAGRFVDRERLPMNSISSAQSAR